MTDHDRLFKELLTTFFLDFLDLFLPEVRAYLDPDSLVFLDKEIFTDVTSGERYEADLIVRARLREQDVFFVIHVEHQAQPQAHFGKRMHFYFTLLGQRLELPVYPIVLFSFERPRRQQPDLYRMEFPDLTVLEFRYRVIQLNRLNWRDFMRHHNPVASALMARMQIAPAERPYVKAECLRLLATLRLNRAKMQLIAGFVDNYLRLTVAEEKVFLREADRHGLTKREGIMEIVTSWELRGREIGLQEGLEKGRREEALTLALRQLEHRFGPLGVRLRRRVERLGLTQLEDLSVALLDFTSPADLKAWLDRLR